MNTAADVHRRIAAATRADGQPLSRLLAEAQERHADEVEAQRRDDAAGEEQRLRDALKQEVGSWIRRRRDAEARGDHAAVEAARTAEAVASRELRAVDPEVAALTGPDGRSPPWPSGWDVARAREHLTSTTSIRVDGQSDFYLYGAMQPLFADAEWTRPYGARADVRIDAVRRVDADHQDADDIRGEPTSDDVAAAMRSLRYRRDLDSNAKEHLALELATHAATLRAIAERARRQRERNAPLPVERPDTSEAEERARTRGTRPLPTAAKLAAEIAERDALPSKPWRGRE